MPAQALAAVATLLACVPHGNRIELQLDRGSAELLWVTPSTFRFRRALEGPLPEIKAGDREPVPVEIDDAPGAVRLRSKFLDIGIQKHGLLVRVRRVDGAPLMTDLTEPGPAGAPAAGGVTWERQALAGVEFYGLGPSTDPVLGLRGKAVRAEIPFLISTAEYGEYHAGAGSYRFDFTAADRYRIQAPGIDYFFYYGPTPKEIFEEHKAVRGAAEPLAGRQGASGAAGPLAGRQGTSGAADAHQRFTDGSWSTLRDSLLRLVHGAMSAVLEPEFDLTPYAKAAPELVQRARQLGSLVPKVTPGPVGLSDFRKQLESFFAVYALEIRDHGHPTWHALPFQFPDDAECARHADEFMLGDEMLVAPIYEPGGKRGVYLPRGMWTNLETNEVSQGRRAITVETKSLPVFARNGSIVPLDSAAGIALHYFPTLAAEFFLLESDIGDYTQVHAAPAGDIMRLEIEAKKDHDYQWVVHHVEKPAEVGFQNVKYRETASPGAMVSGTWFYDAARKNFEVRVHVKAGEDCVINLGW
ncbi:MAG: hypothetical protein ABSH44_17085 [Bryobacteraceae bacterium]|jgi:hypothetical protein